MARHTESYLTGKIGESQTWEYLSQFGFTRPSSKQRANIVTAFEKRGIMIQQRGFDVVPSSFSENLNSVSALETCLDRLVLYEVKTCGVGRRSRVSAGFRGLGFTLTSKEKHNADVLGPQYRFLFVNLRTRTHRVCSLTDFFNEKRALIYQTWSVFITQELP